MKKFIAKISALLFVFVVLIVGVIIQTPQNVQGSVNIGNEYHSTTTPITYAAGTPVLLQEGQGTLGSVVITSSVGAGLYFYDATTTNITKRTGNKATSTLAVIFPLASSTPGTYTFDVVFYDGLIVQASSTPFLPPISTITWR